MYAKCTAKECSYTHDHPETGGEKARYTALQEHFRAISLACPIRPQATGCEQTCGVPFFEAGQLPARPQLQSHAFLLLMS